MARLATGIQSTLSFQQHYITVSCDKYHHDSSGLMSTTPVKILQKALVTTLHQDNCLHTCWCPAWCSKSYFFFNDAK